MTKGVFRLPISVGGSEPDPDVFCPINGYILNPLTEANGWYKIAEFQTNSPSTTTFAPTLSASSGEFAWDLGDGNICVGTKSVEHTYSDSSTKTVKLYGKGTCIITQVYFDQNNIVGLLNLSNDAFKACPVYYLNSNFDLTGVTFHSSPTTGLNFLYLYSCGLIGTLDLSMFTAVIGTQPIIHIHSNPSLAGITFASSITGNLTQLFIHSNPSLAGTLDLSMFTNFTTSAYLLCHSNSTLTGITFASSITGTFTQLFIHSNPYLTGTLDVSGFANFTTSGSIHIYSNPSLAGITFASSITGTISFLQIHSNPSLTGTLDLSMFTNFTTSAYLLCHSNSTLTGITFASSITGTFAQLMFYNNNITGTLDLSMFTKFTTSAYIDFHLNPALTGITFASSITGTINSIYANQTGLITLDLSKFTTYLATGATLRAYSCPNLTTLIFPPSTITGIIKTMDLQNSAITTLTNLVSLKTNIASIAWALQNNSMSAGIVNFILYVINSISGSGYSSRVVNIGGSNSDPDTTSGGYDGLTAKAALISKGITVTTN